MHDARAWRPGGRPSLWLKFEHVHSPADMRRLQGQSGLRDTAMPNVEPHRLAATALVRLIENGELTVEAAVASCLDRIPEREPVVRAWSHLANDAPLARAREI